MFLANCIYISSISMYNFIAKGYPNRRKYSDVTGLEVVRDMGGKTLQGNVICKAKIWDFKRLMCPKAIVDE